jgi:hypothetical protein
MIAILRGLGAGLLSAIISLIAFLLIGVFLPVWAMTLLYRRHTVQDARPVMGASFTHISRESCPRHFR